MGDKSKIEWTDATWNPVTGCTKVSAGCKHCYAERLIGRFAAQHGHGVPTLDGDSTDPPPFSEIRTHPERLDQPLHWRKPRKIFVCSMSDLFHKAVPEEFLEQVFESMFAAPHHIYQILTKRPDRMLRYIRSYEGEFSQANYIWLGVSVEDQATAEARVPLLLQTPAAVRFVSYEPALGPIDLDCYPSTSCPTDWLEGSNGIDWLIAGGESGPKARPMHPTWARDVRDQCVAAGVPYFFKQWGEFIECPKRGGKWAINPTKHTEIVALSGAHFRYLSNWDGSTEGVPMERVGKRAAGRVLDGREWSEFPEVRR